MALDTQNPESNTATVEDMGSEEASIRALSQPVYGEQNADSEPDPENKDSDEDEGETEAEDKTKAETEEADEPTETLVEVEIEGETLEVSPKVQKAIKEGLLRQAEFSRKMNAVGETEKTAKVRLEQAEKLVAGAEKFAEVLSDVNTIDAQIAQFEKVDWSQLRSSNPAEYAALVADMQNLKQGRDTAVKKAQSIDSEVQGIRKAQKDEARAEMVKTLSKDLKGWGDELGSKLTQYAIEQGYSPEYLHDVTDAKWVIAMNKARQFDAIQSEKSGLKGKIQAAQTFVKPGSPRRVDKATEVKTRFMKSPNREDAIKLLS